MPARTSVYPSFQPGLDALARDREVHVRQSVPSHRSRPDTSTHAPGSYRNVTGTHYGSQSSQSRPPASAGRSQSSRRSHDRESGASAARSRSVAARTPTASHHHAASAAQPMPISTRTPSNKSDPRRSSTQPGPRSPSRTPSYQQVPVIPRTSSGSHPSVHQIFQHPSPPGSQTRVYPPQGYGYGYQQPPSGHPYSPPQSVSSSATPSRATSPRSVHRKAPPPIHAYPTQPQQTPSALSLHSVGSLQANGQPAPSIHASLASASSTAFSPSSAGIVSPLTGSISALNLPQSRSRPDVGTGSASGHGHESREDVRSDESHIPPVHRPPQSEADEDLPLSRMILLQPRQASQLPISPPARSHNQPQAQDQSSPPPTHSLDVPQDVDRDRHTPSPGPVHSHPSEQESHGLEHDQHSEVPVRGKPRIFAAMGAEESEADHGDAQPPREQWEHETPLVQGRPRIFAAQEEGGSDEQGADAYAQQDGAYTQPADAYAPQGSAYTQPVQPAEKEFQGQTADGHVRDYPHTHGYPTPRSRSPVLPSDQAAVLRDDEDTRGRRREVLPKDDQDGHRISRSLPPTPSPRAPTPEVQHDTDVEHEKGGSADDHGLGRRRLRKGGKLKRGSSQSDSENEGRRRGHSFGLGLRGIFGVRALTEKQVEKLGAKDGAGAAAGASAVPVNMGAAPMGVAPGVQRSASGSDGRRKLKKDARRGRRDERGDERPTELVRDRADEASFVHIDSSAVQEEMQRGRTGPGAPPTPITPEEYARARAQRRGAKLGKGLPAVIAQALAPSPERKEPLKPSMPYPLVKHLLEPALLAGLLTYLSYNEWLAVAALNRQVRDGVTKRRELTECALEKFLGPVGYARWTWGLDPSLAKARSKERANDGDKEMPRLPNDGEPVTLALQVSTSCSAQGYTC
ncbi:uncharacterized protein C8Q71DRAFT_391479 [Rhodofomes roseus]|uniref:F-box domain-containing protein n=1 Tax=Rhodofomes roseus TaxID=34475 RepID=A0ABQ8JZP3_9APHY|nr:uncharacterized protein C8Q71DRAFT_391479 [Rhodofomes roseus]KAH9829861.1 hypothetical protein C8Q71DRAFT_391479 [Rhodofomes roseus]